MTEAGITQLIVTGVTTEVCVHTTVREANDRGYEVLVLSDCVGSYFPEFQRVGLDMIAAQGGIFGWVSDSAALLQRLPRSPPPRPDLARTVMNLSTILPKSRTDTDFKVPWWTRGDTNAFFGLVLQHLGQRA